MCALVAILQGKVLKKGRLCVSLSPGYLVSSTHSLYIVNVSEVSSFQRLKLMQNYTELLCSDQ